MMMNKKIPNAVLAIALMLPTSLTLSSLEAGTRVLPMPPPRHQEGASVDGTEQESTWGVMPGEDRWNTLQDEEGAEIDFNRRRLSRAPAGLEVKSAGKDSAAGDGWKSTTVDQPRQVVREAQDSRGARPVLKRVSKTEAARADDETERFVAEVQDPIARRKGIQEVSIIAGDLGFFPKTIFVSRDVPVRLFVTGASKGSLCIMMDSFNVRKQVRANKIEEILFVPNQPGTFRYYCPVNGSEGTMVVKELTTATPGES